MTTPRIYGTISKGLSGPGLSADEFEGDLITGQVDLEGDVTPASGATPSSGTIPLLWNHNPATVVGVARYTRVGNRLQIKCTLIPEGTTPEGDLARVCAKGEFGIGLSAGFQPTETTPRKGTSGRTYNRYRLLEASLVAVPCDPAARITARAHNSERDARRAKAEEVAKRGRMDYAVHVANSAPPAAPSAPTTKAERLAVVAAARARGGNNAPPAQPGTPSCYSQATKDAIAHGNRVEALRPPDRSERIIQAGLIARRSRLAGFS